MSERECRTFEKKLAHFTAPTLLGIKCASLVSLSREEFDIPAYAAAFNAQAVRGGLQMQIMCRCQKRQLVLLYRPRLLQKRLEQPDIRLFLLRYGYPLEDVDGFITHQGENCKLCGCWKVYGNVEQARRTFASYEKCRVFLCAKLSKGCNILQALKIS